MDFIERMRAGTEVRCTEPDNGPFLEAMTRAHALCESFNTPGKTEEERFGILDDLLGYSVDRSLIINPTFHCDLGINIKIGKGVKINYDCIFLDCAEIVLEDYAMIGPRVQLITPNHPADPAARRQ